MRLHQGIWSKSSSKKKKIIIKENWSENCTDIWGLKCKSRDDLLGNNRGEQKKLIKLRKPKKITEKPNHEKKNKLN